MTQSEQSAWCAIESDPGVFTELLWGVGVGGVQVEEIYDLEPATFDQLGEVFGVVFLFKWMRPASAASSSSSSSANRGNVEGDDDDDDGGDPLLPRVFFARQMIHNACATLALLNIVMNVEDIQLGDELGGFKEFVAEFPSDMKGEAITNSLLIRNVHNAFGRAEGITVVEDKGEEGSGDAFHFIGFVPMNGFLYELDGLQKGPVNHGPCTKQEWLQKLRLVIQEKTKKYDAEEIRFNLMAIVRDRQQAFEEQLAQLVSRLDALTGQEGADAEADVLRSEVAHVKTEMQREAEKRARYQVENNRRRHNFIPFVYQLLMYLASKDQLRPLILSQKKQ